MCIIRVQGNVTFWIKQKTNQDKNQVTEESTYFNDKKMVLKFNTIFLSLKYVEYTI